MASFRWSGVRNTYCRDELQLKYCSLRGTPNSAKWPSISSNAKRRSRAAIEEELHVHLAILVKHHNAGVRVSVNPDVYNQRPSWASEDDPVYTFSVELAITGISTYPEERAGDTYELTIHGDDAPITGPRYEAQGSAGPRRTWLTSVSDISWKGPAHVRSTQELRASQQNEGRGALDGMALPPYPFGQRYARAAEPEARLILGRARAPERPNEMDSRDVTSNERSVGGMRRHHS
jgi:hypothetical protein